MPFTLRLYQRFPVHCGVTYNMWEIAAIVEVLERKGGVLDYE